MITDLSFASGLDEEQLQQVVEYLNGKRKVFDCKIELDGTEFQKVVWREMMAIPFGHTVTYGSIAEAIGRPRAVRAVGAACGANKLPVIVPCHRVVAANGIGGFGFGIKLKRKLLAHEGVLQYNKPKGRKKG